MEQNTNVLGSKKANQRNIVNEEKVYIKDFFFYNRNFDFTFFPSYHQIFHLKKHFKWTSFFEGKHIKRFHLKGNVVGNWQDIF